MPEPDARFLRATPRRVTRIKRTRRYPAPPIFAFRYNDGRGEVAEWLNAAVSKTVGPARASWVQIPPSPPDISSAAWDLNPGGVGGIPPARISSGGGCSESASAAVGTGYGPRAVLSTASRATHANLLLSIHLRSSYIIGFTGPASEGRGEKTSGLFRTWFHRGRLGKA